MAKRPKESLAGIVGVVGGLYGVKKLANLESSFSQFSTDIARIDSSINRQSAMQAAGFQSLIDLQAGTLFAVSKVNSSIEQLEIELSKVTNIMERQELREEKVGDLKLVIMEIEEALDHIDTLKTEYTPWAAFETRILLDIIDEKDIKIEDFKRLPPTEIKYVRGVLNRVGATHRECLSLLGDKS